METNEMNKQENGTAKKINQVYTMVQSLGNVPMTEGNVALMYNILSTLKQIHSEHMMTEKIRQDMEQELNAMALRVTQLEDERAELLDRLGPAPDDSICDEAPENIGEAEETEETEEEKDPRDIAWAR